MHHKTFSIKQRNKQVLFSGVQTKHAQMGFKAQIFACFFRDDVRDKKLLTKKE